MIKELVNRLIKVHGDILLQDPYLDGLVSEVKDLAEDKEKNESN